MTTRTRFSLNDEVSQTIEMFAREQECSSSKAAEQLIAAGWVALHTPQLNAPLLSNIVSTMATLSDNLCARIDNLIFDMTEDISLDLHDIKKLAIASMALHGQFGNDEVSDEEIDVALSVSSKYFDKEI